VHFKKSTRNLGNLLRVLNFYRGNSLARHLPFSMVSELETLKEMGPSVRSELLNEWHLQCRQVSDFFLVDVRVKAKVKCL
jgi:hypothetical protein